MGNLQTITTLDDGRAAEPTTEKIRCGSAAPHTGDARGLRVAYLTSRFPKITETFILFEMRAVESLGVHVELYPLWREPAEIMHAEARPYMRRAHFERLISGRMLAANFTLLLRRPGTYLRTLGAGLRANWGSKRYFLGFLASFPKAVAFARDIQQRRIQHVHAHFASHPAAAAWVIHRLTGIPYSFTAHGSDLHRDQHMLREKVADADLVVAISEYNRRLILAHCGAQHQQRVQVIHCGTDTEAFRPQSDARQGPGQESPRPDAKLQIACVGTLHEVKGQVHLLHACRLLQDRKVPFQLHLIGDGPDEAMLRAEAVRCGIDSAVVFHGRCTRQQLAGLLPEIDVVVAPSVPTSDGRREGIPVALMEAMSAGVAVVASSLSGIPELVRDRSSGLLVPPGDATAIAAALQELAADPQWRMRLADAARETVELEFDQRRCAERLIEAIRRLHEAERSEPQTDPQRLAREAQG